MELLWTHETLTARAELFRSPTRPGYYMLQVGDDDASECSQITLSGEDLKAMIRAIGK